jgi:hypothetical protein
MSLECDLSTPDDHAWRAVTAHCVESDRNAVAHLVCLWPNPVVSWPLVQL